MSLDVSLYRKYHVSYDCGETLEEKTEEVYDGNITHNLGNMAREAGIYDAMWHPYDISASKAKDIIEVLEKGLKLLKSKPEYFKTFDAPNGWGIYDHFIPFVENYLNACRKYPEAEIHTST